MGKHGSEKGSVDARIYSLTKPQERGENMRKYLFKFLRQFYFLQLHQDCKVLAPLRVLKCNCFTHAMYLPSPVYCVSVYSFCCIMVSRNH